MPSPIGLAEALEPCPFCGSKNVGWRGFRKMECWDCHAEGPLAKGASALDMDTPAAAWNRRAAAALSALREPDEATVEMVARIVDPWAFNFIGEAGWQTQIDKARDKARAILAALAGEKG